MNPYSPYEGAVGSLSKVYNEDKNSSLWNDMNFSADGPQRHLGGSLVFTNEEPAPTEISAPLAAPTEISAPIASANATVVPAAYDVPYWNKTQDKSKPYRYRETYGTMNDKYDTWDTQIKYKKQNLAAIDKWDGLFHDTDGNKYFPNGQSVDGANNFF